MKKEQVWPVVGEDSFRHSGLLAEPVIGPRFARTRSVGPGMTGG